jgi:hypothetical protein
MAMANPTLNKALGGRPSAPLYAIDLSIAGDSSYPTGGTASFKAKVVAAAKAADPSLRIDADNIMGILPLDTKGYQLAYDKANDKLKVYYVDNDAVADSAMIEVPNTTDLSAVTFRASFILG